MTGPAPTLAARRLLAARCRGQGLSGDRFDTCLDAVDRLLAVQAQDLRGARLTIRPRTRGVRAADVDHALTHDRSLVVTWLNRGTLHLVRSADYWWLHALTTPQVATSNARRLRQEGVDADAAERGVRTIVSALTAHGPLLRDELREHLASADVPIAGQALVHLFFLASNRGLIVRGPMVGDEQAFVLVRDWLGAPPPMGSHEQMLAMLARRYLAGHGPAGAEDLAKWAGITLGAARLAMRSIASDVEALGGGMTALMGESALDAAFDVLPPPTLLGAFDELLMGWRSRELVLPIDGGVVTSNGVFRPVVLVDGRGVATWSLRRGEVVMGEPFGALPDAAGPALEAEALDVIRFLGLAAD